ncbi:hypothetical protein DPMN_141695 [Dreissena polymorpha]|uniref:FAM124 domain-containing protein n=1 Tax=Dreissena polymorpha TaxID=45954 RepID=A0A9D4JLI2_DREPO|nr:hypothetical protein DPMN_141695 [Dreissena polymorpha]
MTSFPLNSAHLPGVALIVFLQENGAVGFERIQAVKRFFEKSPWKFHHSEQVQRGAINPYPYNSRDFYYTSEDLPLCAVRQVHTGKEFLRVMIFVSEANWLQMMQFYKLVLGKETDLKRDDFCMFTVCSFPSYDVQLALKKLQGDTKPRALGGVRLQFRLNDVSNIMAFLPNVCHPLSDTRWQTTDNDGNVIVLETPRFYGNSTFMDRCSLSSRGSITGRSSSSRSGSFTRPAKTGQNLQRERMRASVENKRPSGSPRAMRAHSVLVDKDLIEKIKTENKAYKELTQRAFVEHFKTLTANDVEVKRKTTDFSSANTLPVITNSFYV